MCEAYGTTFLNFTGIQEIKNILRWQPFMREIPQQQIYSLVQDDALLADEVVKCWKTGQTDYLSVVSFVSELVKEFSVECFCISYVVPLSITDLSFGYTKVPQSDCLQRICTEQGGQSGYFTVTDPGSYL